MKWFTKTMLTSSLGIAVLAGSLAGTHFVHAAPTKNISIIVNNETAPADVTPYIKNGATLVPLTAIKNIPNVAISCQIYQGVSGFSNLMKKRIEPR